MKNKTILTILLLLFCVESCKGLFKNTVPMLCTGEDANIACLAKNNINLSLSEPEVNQDHYNQIFNKAYTDGLMCKDTVPFLNLWDYLKGNAEHAEIYDDFIYDLCLQNFECCLNSMQQVKPEIKNEIFITLHTWRGESEKFKNLFTDLKDPKFSSIRQEFLNYVNENSK